MLSNNHKSSSAVSKKKKAPGKRLISVLIIILGIIVIAYIVLPFVILHYANRTLAKDMPGYYGHVEDIDVALLRGAYKLNNIYINKVDSATNQQLAFFRSDVVDLSIEWKALLHGKIVGKMIFQKPSLRFTKDKAEPAQVQQDTGSFRMVLKKFMPLEVNRFEVNHGIISYRDSTRKPAIALDMTEAHILAQNLKNSYDSAAVLPATVKADARLYQGHMNFEMKLNPLADNPTFDMNTELQNTNLTDFNEFFKAYGNFDVSRGNLNLYSEMAAKDGKFKGYVKPIIKDLKVYGPQDRNDTFLQKLWEHVVGAVAGILKNKSNGQLATKVPLEGTFDNPKTGTLDAIVEAIKNAFIQALMPSIDNEINLNSVGQPEEKQGFFKKLFNKKKENEKTAANK